MCFLLCGWELSSCRLQLPLVSKGPVGKIRSSRNVFFCRNVIVTIRPQILASKTLESKSIDTLYITVIYKRKEISQKKFGQYSTALTDLCLPCEHFKYHHSL